MENTVYAKLLAIKDGNYTNYVFKNLDNNKYLMCTKLPNWKIPDIALNEEGYLQLEYVEAGSEYFNVNLEKNKKYLYSNVYLKNFIRKSINMNENSEIIL